MIEVRTYSFNDQGKLAEVNTREALVHLKVGQDVEDAHYDVIHRESFEHLYTTRRLVGPVDLVVSRQIANGIKVVTEGCAGETAVHAVVAGLKLILEDYEANVRRSITYHWKTYGEGLSVRRRKLEFDGIPVEMAEWKPGSPTVSYRGGWGGKRGELQAFIEKELL